MHKNMGLIKSTLQITFFSIIGIIIGFLTQLIIAYYFGTKFERDAYFVAAIIPTYITSIFIGSFGFIFLPKVVDILNRKDPQALNVFISSTFSLIFIALLFTALVCIIFSNSVTKIIAPGYSPEQIVFTARVLIIIVPTIIFSVLGNLLGSLYQIQHKFIKPALAPIISSIISLIFVITLSNKIGILGLAIGFLIGSIISFITLLPVLKNYNLKLIINFKNDDVILFIKTLTPLFLTGILFRSTGVIERMIASNLPQGSVSFLGYASQLLSVLGTVTASGIVISIYPTLSKFWSEKKNLEFSNMFTKSIRIILLISIPISFSVFLFGDQLVKIIFERGAFTASDSIAVTTALIWSMGAFIFQGLGGVIAKVLYISNATIISSLIATIELIIYFTIGLYLSKYYSFIGLSIALSISSMINIFLSLLFINMKVIKLNFAAILKDISKICISSAVGVVTAYFVYNYIFIINNNNIKISFCLIIEIGIILIIGRLLKIEEIQYIQNIIKNKFIR